VDIGFFGAHAKLPVGIAMLLAAVAGALVVIIPGTGRILQLRATARRHRKLDAAAAAAAARPAAVPQPPPAEPPPAQSAAPEPPRGPQPPAMQQPPAAEQPPATH
jgi:hypothetical protein